jgi:gamma-glutamyltranspeptidase/glutathione hydrolase
MQLDDWSATRGGARSKQGVVAGGHPAEVEAGLEILGAGGNAFDAIVAANFVACVVEPAMTHLGGYTRLAGYDARAQEAVSVDAYLRAPQAAHERLFEIDETKPLKYYETPWTRGYSAERGFKSAGVPGLVAGLYWTQRHLGRLPWAAVLQPAIRQARQGVEVSWALWQRLAENRDTLQDYPETFKVLFPGGKAPSAATQTAAGERLVFPQLAETLERIAAEGADGFYKGEVARKIGAFFRENGGILSEADLAAYRPRVMKERPQRYRGLDYVTCYDQVGIECLNVLEQFDLATLGRHSAEYFHVMAEAMAVAFTDSIQHYGDPDQGFRAVAEALANPALGAWWAKQIRLDRALPRPVKAADLKAFAFEAIELRMDLAWPPKLQGTTQLAVADAEGNMASVITSISASFGSQVLVPGTGVLLNNGMGNFDPRPGRPNSIRPGAMPIFAVPTLLAYDDQGAAFASGGSGGYRIMPAILFPFVNWRDFGLDLPAAIDAPRLHCQGKDTFLDSRVSAAVRDRLAALGHTLHLQRDDPGLNAFGRVSAVARGKDGGLEAASGPAWLGAAGGL